MSKELREHWVLEAGEPYKTVLLTQKQEVLEKYKNARVFFDVELIIFEDLSACKEPLEERPLEFFEIFNRAKEELPEVYFENQDMHILKLTIIKSISLDRFKFDIKVYENVDPEMKCCVCGKIQQTNESFVGSATGSNGNYTYVFWCNPCWEEKERGQ